ncbi:hypothetical protein Tco_0475900 [Tanacetum coccineum]
MFLVEVMLVGDGVSFSKLDPQFDLLFGIRLTMANLHLLSLIDADLCPLKDMFSNRDIARSGFSLDDSTNNLIADGVWRWLLDWLSTFPIMAQLQVPLLLDDINDVILWHDRDGVLWPFSVACAWDTIWTRADIVNCMDSIPPRLIDVTTFINPISKGKTMVSILFKLVLAATSYYIWLERNGRLFKKKTSSPDQIVDVIISMVRLKLVTFKFKKMSTWSRLLLDQWKIPSFCIVHDGSSRLTWIVSVPVVLLLLCGMLA